MDLAVAGLSNKEIGSQLKISPKTVENHRAWVMERIGARNIAELVRLANMPKGSGGDFYLTTAARVSRRFARALVESTLEGRTLYRDAFRMLGISKTETLHELGRSLQFQI